MKQFKDRYGTDLMVGDRINRIAIVDGQPRVIDSGLVTGFSGRGVVKVFLEETGITSWVPGTQLALDDIL